ncbi:MAG: alginate export family protein [Polaromonas sp.]
MSAHLKPLLRTASLCVVWSAALAATAGAVMPVVAAELTNDRVDIASTGALALQAGPAAEPLLDQATGTAGLQALPMESAADSVTGTQLAQFQLPKASSGEPGSPDAPRYPERPLIQYLKYQFSYGSESDITYRRNPDLDKRLRDNSLILAPQVNGSVIYRPNARLEMMLELILEREVAASEQGVVTLPSGQTHITPRRRASLLVDQAWVKFKELGPFEMTLGRRNFEDGRHWLYDTSLDTAFVKFKQGAYQAELSVSRKDRLDLDLFAPVQKTRTDNYMFYLDYRGIEDIKVAGYTIARNDRTGKEGKPLHLGLRAYGMPSDRFNFWTELALLRGKDAAQKNFRAHAFDVGATYRFPALPYTPNITLGYAYGSGDDKPNDSVNHEFRQTGLQSNEGKFGGIPNLKYYGETFDPELSNLQLLTAGLGFRPAPNISVDLVYHHYRLNKIADEIRNSALTAQINQDDARLSKNAGHALDVVLGFRNLFGVRRLGLDVRAGLFFPGKAFRNEDPVTGEFRNANKSMSVLAKIWF